MSKQYLNIDLILPLTCACFHLRSLSSLVLSFMQRVCVAKNAFFSQRSRKTKPSAQHNGTENMVRCHCALLQKVK